MATEIKDNKGIRFDSGTIDVEKGKNIDEYRIDDEFHADNKDDISSMVDELIRHYSKNDDDQEENETELDLFEIESSLAADDEFRSDLTGDVGFKIVSSCNNEAAYQSALSLFIQSFFIELFAFRRQRITCRICNLIHRRFGKDTSVAFANTTNLISRTGRDLVYSSESPAERMDICIFFLNVAKEGGNCCIEALLIARHVGILAKDKHQDVGSLQRDGAEYLAKHLFGGFPGSITRRDVHLAGGVISNYTRNLFEEIVIQSSKALDIERIEVVVGLIEVLSKCGMSNMLQSFLGGEAGVDWVSVAMGYCDDTEDLLEVGLLKNDGTEDVIEDLFDLDVFKDFFGGLMKAVPVKATMIILKKWEIEIDKIKEARSLKKLFKLTAEVGKDLSKKDDYLEKISTPNGNEVIDAFCDKLTEAQKHLDEEERKELCVDDALCPWLDVQFRVKLLAQDNDNTKKDKMKRKVKRGVLFSKSCVEMKGLEESERSKVSPLSEEVEIDVESQRTKREKTMAFSASTNEDKSKRADDKIRRANDDEIKRANDDEIKKSTRSPCCNKLPNLCAKKYLLALLTIIITGVIVLAVIMVLKNKKSNPTEIENVILEISPASTSNSIQFNPSGMALRWITNEDKRKLNATNPTLIQRYTMALLYYSTFGEYWSQNQHWLSEESECDWFGITCDNAGYVWDVSLGGNNMTGALPYEIITSVPHLQNLFLHNNSITGPLPSIPEGMNVESSLKSLSLEFNEFTGSVPSNWMRYLNTTYLYLRSNRLDGTFPVISSENFHIQLLDLSSNNIGGSLPTSITKLVNLAELHLHDNSFSGELPSSVSDLSSLDELSLYYNELTGTIPCAKFTLKSPHIRISSDCLAKNAMSPEDVICPCCVICCTSDKPGARCEDIVAHNASKRMKIGHDVERKRWRNNA